MPFLELRKRMLQRLRERGFDDLEIAHLSVFQYPGPNGLRPTQLAAQLGMTKQAVNYLLGQMERRGYVERRPDPDDVRSKRIALTSRGEAATRTIIDAIAEIEQDWSERLGEERFAQLRELLVEVNSLSD